MKTILFVHQAAELYGSDRMLLTLVGGLDPSAYRAVVALPSDGPLVRELEAVGARVHVLPLARVERATLRASAAVTLPLTAAASAQALDRALRIERVDCVVSNTLAVLTGFAWARWRRVPHLWHVHELVERPILARRAYAQLLRRSTRVVFNSQATRRCYVDACPELARTSELVLNGASRPAPPNAEAANALRQELGVDADAFVVACVGRISDRKGQRLLVDVAEHLPSVVVAIAGSHPPGQIQSLLELEARMRSSPARDRVRLLGVRDPWPIYDASDVVVVPSIRPESFGLVALEAMLASRPVIASDTGALGELVEAGRSGRLVRPGSATDLARAIAELAEDPDLRRTMGQRGRVIAEERFAPKRYVAAMTQAMRTASS